MIHLVNCGKYNNLALLSTNVQTPWTLLGRPTRRCTSIRMLAHHTPNKACAQQSAFSSQNRGSRGEKAPYMYPLAQRTNTTPCNLVTRHPPPRPLVSSVDVSIITHQLLSPWSFSSSSSRWPSSSTASSWSFSSWPSVMRMCSTVSRSQSNLWNNASCLKAVQYYYWLYWRALKTQKTHTRGGFRGDSANEDWLFSTVFAIYPPMCHMRQGYFSGRTASPACGQYFGPIPYYRL